MKTPSIFSSTIRVDCPDGKPRFILRKPEKAFAIAFPRWDFRIDSLVKLFNKVEAKLDPQVVKQTKSIVDRLTENYATIQAQYQIAYLAWCGNPCSIDAEVAFNKERQKILQKEATLRKLEIETKKLAIKESESDLRSKVAAKRSKERKPTIIPKEKKYEISNEALEAIKKIVADLKL